MRREIVGDPVPQNSYELFAPNNTAKTLEIEKRLQ